MKSLNITGQFLKPYAMELLDTLWYMLKELLLLIKSILPKKELIWDWRKGRAELNFKKYFLYILLFYFLLHVFISKVRANETFVIPKIEMSEEEKQHDNALYKKVVKDIDDLNNKQTYELSRTITPKESANQNCYVSVKITQEGESVVKKEILECADGRKGLITPGYWEMFAQFYYKEVSAPEYCRYYSRPDHAFKSFGKTCLNKNGEWRIVQ
jgi:hypothetical protein